MTDSYEALKSAYSQRLTPQPRHHMVSPDPARGPGPLGLILLIVGRGSSMIRCVKELFRDIVFSVFVRRLVRTTNVGVALGAGQFSPARTMCERFWGSLESSPGGLGDAVVSDQGLLRNTEEGRGWGFGGGTWGRWSRPQKSLGPCPPPSADTQRQLSLSTEPTGLIRIGL
jgi:hypothetical protein